MDLVCETCKSFVNWEERFEPRRLVIVCSACATETESANALVWKKTYQTAVFHSTHRYEHAAFDCTLPAANWMTCPKCQASNVRYFQEPSCYVYTCTECNHVFNKQVD